MSLALLSIAAASPVARAAGITVVSRSGFIDSVAHAATTQDDEQTVSNEPSIPGGTSPGTFTIDGSLPFAASRNTQNGSSQANVGASLSVTLSTDPTTGAVTYSSSGHGDSTASATGTTDTNFPTAFVGANAGESDGASLRFTVDAAATYTFSASWGQSGTGSTDGEAGLTPISGGTPIFTVSPGQSGMQSGNLAPGTYLLDVGESAGASASGTQRGQTDSKQAHSTDSFTFKVTPSPCPGGTTSVTVGLATAQGCFTQRQDSQGHGTGVFETAGEAWLGGFDLKPASGGKLVLNPADHANPVTAEGAGVNWVLGDVSVPAPLSELKPFLPSFTVGLNTAGTIGRVAAVPLLQSGQNGVGSQASVKVTWISGGASAKVEAGVSLEELTKSVGDLVSAPSAGSGNVGTVAAKLTLSFVNGEPFEVTAGELQIPDFTVELKDTQPPIKEGFGGGKFKAQKVGDTVEWSAEVSVFFPWEGDSGLNQGQITGRLFYTDSHLGGIGLGVSGFEVPIAKTGWDLTGADGNIILFPQPAFDFGIKAQEHIALRGVPLFKLTGNVKGLRLARMDCPNGQNPFAFVGTSNAPPLEEAKLGSLLATVTFCAYVPSAKDFAFEAKVSGDLNIDVLGTFKRLFAASGSASGWFSGTQFNLDGSYNIQIPIIGTIGAKGVLSSEGYAFCGQYGFISAGFATNNWLEAPQDLTGCDFTPFRVAPPPPGPAADAAIGARAVSVPSGQRAFSFAIRGRGGAPHVRISGPGGTRFTTPAGARALKTKRAIIVPFPARSTTYVFLNRPAGGLWHIAPLAGPAIRSIDVARELPAPRVTARVSARHGVVTVRWAADAAPGRKLELLDRADGLARVIQKPTRHRQGTIRFHAEDPLARHRTIEAIVTQNGAPRAQLTVAPYRLRPPARPGPVSHLTARRTTAGLNVSWQAARRAHDYLVTVSAGTSVLVRAQTTRLSLLIKGMPTGTLTIRVQARDTFGRPGPAASVTVH